MLHKTEEKTTHSVTEISDLPMGGMLAFVTCFKRNQCPFFFLGTVLKFYALLEI